MNRIDKKFRELKKLGRKAFIAYITAGDPGINMTERIVLALESSGADIVELGIPFSDPVADGPTIQAASQRALAKGANLKKIFAMVRSLRRKCAMPIVFMTYYNPIFKFGVSAFFKACRTCGVDGVIIPDLPIEESLQAVKLGAKNDVAVIFLIAPTTPIIRIKKIAARSKGFIYYVSLAGVTGARNRLPLKISDRVRLIKSVTAKPVAVGFGISNPAQARSIADTADGVIVGSAIVKIVGARKDVIAKVSEFTRSMASAIHRR